jgi:phytanoyl-CoA hydroxylase
MSATTMMDDLRKEFQTKGFVKIPKSVYSLDSSTVTKLRDEFDKLFAGDYETGVYPDEIHWRAGISKEHVTRELCNAWKASTAIRSIVADEALGSLACTLMGWNSSRLGQDDVLHKPPSSNNPVGFHQDGAYISDNFIPRDDNCLTMWIALDDADSENGALQYAPGSHRWNDAKDNSNSEVVVVNENVAASSFHVTETEDYLTPLRQAAVRAGQLVGEIESSIETIKVPTGELLVHHQNIWHGSGPNTSKTRTRRSLVAHLIDGEVEWRMGSKPPHYIYGRYYIRGELIPREDFFPVTCSKSDNSGLRRTAWLDE